MLGTQGEIHHFSTTTALWIVGLPFMDMLRVTITRKMNSKSMFKADRTHLHHVLERICSSHKAITMTIAGLTTIFSLVGILFDYFQVPLSLSLLLFFISFYLYVKIVNTIKNL